MRESQLDITGAWRHVHHQIIQVIPGSLGDQLQQRTGDHRPAPDHRGVLIGEKGHGHHFHAMSLERHKPLLVFHLWPRAFRDTKHDALARPIDISIQNADLGTLAGQRQRQIGGSGGFTHPAFAGCHGNHVFHIRQRRHLILRLVRLNHAIDLHLSALDAIEPLQSHLQHLRPASLE